MAEQQSDAPTFDELTITRGIVETFTADFLDSLDLDVALVGAGPANLTAARVLGNMGVRIAVFERNLQIGGGIWGGGMLMPRIVIGEGAAHLMTECGVRLRPYRDGCVVADAVEAVTKLTAAACDAGARIWVGMEVEDVVIDDEARISGVVINWGAVTAAHLHVDPLAVHARCVIDGTGHPAEVCRVVLDKVPGAKFDTPFDCVPGEASMHAVRGEAALVPNTREVYPGLVVSGMAANACMRSPRMGAIFGGMLLSGERAAQVAAEVVARRR
ncbi:MAG TPA: sulfide-dependent adenosine diphosphate thiazole synthase [Armatimonadota bacterium]|nr:sulfide-dependent adenosine diphosphate thiazole synthase [Armatimonadota bacterium]